MKRIKIKNLVAFTLFMTFSNAYANECVERFEEHSKLSSDLEKHYKICETKNLTYNKWSINGIDWSKYFQCFDTMEKHIEKRPFFFHTCLDYNFNRYINSFKFSTCEEEMTKNHPEKNVLLCLDEKIGNGVYAWGFDDCMKDAKKFKLNYMDTLKICIENDSDKRVSCASDILSIHKFHEGLKICEDYQARINVQKNIYLPCMTNLTGAGVSKTNAIKLCTSKDINDSIECINNNKDKFPLSLLTASCVEEKFRDSAENKNFSTCVENLKKDNLSIHESLEMCTQEDDVIDLFAHSKDFQNCKATVKSKYNFSTKSAYSSCADAEIRNQIDNNEFMSCFEKGINTGILGYFDYRTDELEDGFSFSLFNNKNTNPYYYVIDNCFDDQKYRRTSVKNKYLSLYGDYNIHSNTIFKQERVVLGGLSALRFDSENSKVFFLSDDKGRYGEPRIYVYDYKFGKAGIELNEDKLIKFKKKQKLPLKGGPSQDGKVPAENDSFSWGMDPEGMDFGANGEIIISSEVGSHSADEAITIFSPDGVKVSNLPIAESYKAGTGKDFHKGMQFNKGIESLSISPSKSSLFIANESTLKQDDKYTWKDGDCWMDCIKFVGETVRITKYIKDAKTYSEDAQYFYVLDNETDNGVSEVLALDENNLLILERSWDAGRRKITSKIFHVNLNSAQPIPAELSQEEKEEAEEEEEEEKEEQKDDDESSEDGKRRITLRPANNNNDKPSENKIDPYQIPSGTYFHMGDKYGPYDPSQRHFQDVQPVSRQRAQTNYKQKKKKKKKAEAEKIKDYTLEKTLLIDLDDILNELSPGFRRLDNFEGLAIGPILPNGRPSLALVADNNFSLGQRSLFILLEIDQRAWARLLRN